MGGLFEATQFSGGDERDIFGAAPVDDDRLSVLGGRVAEGGQRGARLSVRGLDGHARLLLLYRITVQKSAAEVKRMQARLTPQSSGAVGKERKCLQRGKVLPVLLRSAV